MNWASTKGSFSSDFGLDAAEGITLLAASASDFPAPPFPSACCSSSIVPEILSRNFQYTPAPTRTIASRIKKFFTVHSSRCTKVRHICQTHDVNAAYSSDKVGREKRGCLVLNIRFSDRMSPIVHRTCSTTPVV